MSVHIRPLLSSLRRNPTGAVLVVLQVAITLAVLVNAAWIVTRRIGKIDEPTGIDTRDTFQIGVSGSSKRFNIAHAESEDLAYLRSLPGVVAATVTSGTPLTPNGQGTTLAHEPGTAGSYVSADYLNIDAQGLKTLDVPLVAGRNFRPGEIRQFSHGKRAPVTEIIVTQSLARALFPHGNALGKVVYQYEGTTTPMTIIGITRDFMGPRVGMPKYNTALVPSRPGTGGFYLLMVRARPGMRDKVMREAKQHIGTAHRYGVVGFSITLSEAEKRMHAGNRNTAIFLTIVTALMLAVCCLGIFGLSTFNVGSRTRQIGTRRALGARKRDIVSHFLVENAILLTAGALLGTVLALAVGDWLTARYGLPRLDPAYLLAGVAALWAVGELAAWQPARRAADIPPSVATRTI